MISETSDPAVNGQTTNVSALNCASVQRLSWIMKLDSSLTADSLLYLSHFHDLIRKRYRHYAAARRIDTLKEYDIKDSNFELIRTEINHKDKYNSFPNHLPKHLRWYFLCSNRFVIIAIPTLRFIRDITVNRPGVRVSKAHNYRCQAQARSFVKNGCTRWFHLHLALAWIRWSTSRCIKLTIHRRDTQISEGCLAWSSHGGELNKLYKAWLVRNLGTWQPEQSSIWRKAIPGRFDNALQRELSRRD